MVICRISRAEPLSVLATQSWGQAGVLVHMETAVSRLHHWLSFFEVGFVTLGKASLEHASDFATHPLTVFKPFLSLKRMHVA